MKKFLGILLAAFLPFALLAQQQQQQEETLDKKINAWMAPATDVISDIIFVPVHLGVEGEIVNYSQAEFDGLADDGKFTVSLNGEEKTITKADFNQYLTDNSLSLQGENTFSDGGKIYRFGIPFVLIWLIVGAAFFTVYMGFINIRGFRLAIDIVRGKYDDPNDQGEVSHFQALTAALSGTVGLGNIAGVAIAIAAGGPGATFWMILAGLLGMSSKFTECTLGVLYRNVKPDGEVSGGPMYYLSKGFKERGSLMSKVGLFFGGFFAIMCVGGSFGGGNMFQINQACQQFINITGGESSFLFGRGWIFGMIAAVLVAVVIIGGIRSIAKVTDKIVPFMCGLYVLAALVIIFGNVGRVPEAFGLIFSGAFTPAGITGGLIGVLIQGFRRAAFSNEAGVGSAAIAHSAVKTNEPVSEGIVALLEPFIDTVVVCTMTALVIVITNIEGGFLDYGSTAGLNGVTLTSTAFESMIPGAEYILGVAVILFAFSTMISWSYYGLKSWKFLFGDNKVADYTYKGLFCAFVVVGSAMSLGKVTDFSDAMIFAMCFPNIVGLYLLAPRVKRELRSYLDRIKSGEIKRFS